jgi:hypothetical protein
MEGANVPVDEAAEERKGGAGDLGKVLDAGGWCGGSCVAQKATEQVSSRSRPPLVSIDAPAPPAVLPVCR